MTQQITLTSEQQQYVNDLGRLLDFSRQQLSSTKIRLSKLKTRKRILFGMLIAAHNYTESIFVLLGGARTHACHGLLRSLLEIFINSRYIFTSRDFRIPARFALRGEEELLNKFEQMRKYRIEHPNLDTNKETITDSKLYEAATAITENIETIRKKYPNIRQAGDLRSRTRAVDKFNFRKFGKIESPLEWHHLALYWYFSDFQHLSVRGLDKFFKITDQGIEVLLSGDPDNVIPICVSAYAWYLGVLDSFSHQFGMPSRRDIKPYIDKFKSYAKES